MSEVLLRASGIGRTYRSGAAEIRILKGLDLTLRGGEIVAVVGASGVGKSTLLHILGLLDRPDEGTLELGGRDLSGVSGRERDGIRNLEIGFVFQSYHLLDDLTVAENLDLPLSYRDVKKSERDSIVCDVLDRFSIVGKKDLYPSQLSGGQQQLVAVARAVIANPKVILADEPTGNLHSSQGREIMELFKKLNDAGTTIVQVTHSETNAAFGSRIIQLKDGWLVD